MPLTAAEKARAYRQRHPERARESRRRADAKRRGTDYDPHKPQGNRVECRMREPRRSERKSASKPGMRPMSYQDLRARLLARVSTP